MSSLFILALSVINFRPERILYVISTSLVCQQWSKYDQEMLQSYMLINKVIKLLAYVNDSRVTVQYFALRNADS